MLLLEPSQLLRLREAAHTGWQQKGVPEEGEIGRTYTIRDFLHAFQAFSRSASPRDAVSAAGPLSAHGKDKPGLGAPNSLKLPHCNINNTFLKYVLCGRPPVSPATRNLDFDPLLLT